jgi:hypothetical protein
MTGAIISLFTQRVHNSHACAQTVCMSSFSPLFFIAQANTALLLQQCSTQYRSSLSTAINLPCLLLQLFYFFVDFCCNSSVSFLNMIYAVLHFMGLIRASMFVSACYCYLTNPFPPLPPQCCTTSARWVLYVGVLSIVTCY